MERLGDILSPNGFVIHPGKGCAIAVPYESCLLIYGLDEGANAEYFAGTIHHEMPVLPSGPVGLGRSLAGEEAYEVTGVKGE